jgi:uncharacterized protein (DUF1800 family)
MVRLCTSALLTLVMVWGAGGVCAQDDSVAAAKIVAPDSAQQTTSIQVYEGTAVAPGSRGIPHETGVVDFGSTRVATVVPKTFTIKNAGTSKVEIDPEVVLPEGFTPQRYVGATTLAPGQTTTFVVALNSAIAGRLGGPLVLRTSANPVRFRITGTALGPPSMRIIGNGDIGFRTIGVWAPVKGQGLPGMIRYAPAGTGANMATWTFTGLRPGQYRVAATWTTGSNRASNASYTIVGGTVPLGSVSVNQRAAPADFTDAGTAWQNLGGSYRITGDTLVVQLSDRADGYVVADAVRIERVGQVGRIIDDADAGFETSGTWAKSIGGFRSTQAVSTSNHAVATWTFSGLQPGFYRVSATWNQSTTAASDAAFAILDGTTAIAKVNVNQQVAPQDFTDAGAGWKDLGELGQLYPIAGTTLVVRLSGKGSGSVLADGVRIERIYNPCGGGPGSQDGLPDVIRFLEQSTFGPRQDFIDHIMIDLGGDLGAFIDEQIDPNITGISSYATLPLVPGNRTTGCNDLGNPPNCPRDNYTMYLHQRQFFTNALYGSDQLRQRMAFILHQIFVVSQIEVTHPSQMSTYLQTLANDAFGNYRQLLYDVTLNPAMGKYLSMQGSAKVRPNENYGREILQLFSIGLNELNPNGTQMQDPQGQPIPTHDQNVVDNFAKAFTGWVFHARDPQRDFPNTTNYIDPMVVHTPVATYHDQTMKTLLQRSTSNRTMAANRTTLQDLNGALDNIFHHPNVPPFICRQLIQHLVTSNPSTPYVNRVSNKFRNNGSGVRGDLGTVVRWILLDPEARGDVPPAGQPNFGHQREPSLYALNVLRLFNAMSHDDPTVPSDGYLNPQTVGMGMDVFRPPTVFSYFDPNKMITGTAGVRGGEFQIYSTATAVKRANFINTMTFGGGIRVSNPNAPNGTAIDLSGLQAMASDPGAMADWLNTCLLHGTMSAQMRSTIVDAVNTVAAGNPLKRARTALYLAATSSQYQVEN